jgi:hypothetical protein
MSNVDLIDSAIKLPVLCPECGGECEYIQTGKQGNFATNEPTRFVAFFGCKPCYAVIVADCAQVWGAFEWDHQSQADQEENFIRNRVDEYFGKELDDE